MVLGQNVVLQDGVGDLLEHLTALLLVLVVAAAAALEEPGLGIEGISESSKRGKLVVIIVVLGLLECLVVGSKEGDGIACLGVIEALVDVVLKLEELDKGRVLVVVFLQLLPDGLLGLVVAKDLLSQVGHGVPGKLRDLLDIVPLKEGTSERQRRECE